MAAKKRKKAVAKAAPKKSAGKSVAARREAVLQATKEALAAVKRGAKPATIGALVMGRILEGKMTTEEIANEARKRCKGETTPAVVYWHRAHLKGLGVALPARADA